MRDKAIYSGVATITLALLIASYWYLVPDIQETGPLLDALSAASEHLSSVDLSKEARFEWDEVFVVKPYADKEDLRAAFGFRWRALEGSGIWYSEGYSLLVFMKRGRMVRVYKHPNSEGDFDKLVRGPYRTIAVYPPDHATFVPKAVPYGGGSRVFFYAEDL